MSRFEIQRGTASIVRLTKSERCLNLENVNLPSGDPEIQDRHCIETLNLRLYANTFSALPEWMGMANELVKILTRNARAFLYTQIFIQKLFNKESLYGKQIQI